MKKRRNPEMALWRVWWLEPMPGVWIEGKIILEENNCEVIVGRLQTEAEEPYSEDEIVEGGKDVDALLVIARERITARILEELDDLKIVVKAGIGVDNIDVDAATRFGVLVANTPVPADYVGVAEGAVARILALAKRLHACDGEVKAGRWLRRYDLLRGVYMKGKTLGIIGLGRIGSYVARLMKPWGVKIIAYDPYVPKEKAVLLDVELVELDTLFRQSDFISIHAVLTQETRHMIDEAALRMMKKTAYIINTARGPIIREEALYKALNEGWIAGAALDVYEEEPLPPESPLLRPEVADRLILSPHVAGLNPEMERGLTLAQVDCCLKALRGEPPESTVNPEAIPKWRSRFEKKTP
ncbi:MAG: 3-phosphoglycerate dehydrogenase [Candidatus Bathyarchaeota archaeon B26-2]|nr:MAG: 3-phosphoglycerate dehydrogenase [Candidatus Bathyarchaeota archaeon B26-2]